MIIDYSHVNPVDMFQPPAASLNIITGSKGKQLSELCPQVPVMSSEFNPSPPSLLSSRKVRGEGKKCRKVYGMENRDMWCTACRWKKACQRFTD